MSWTEEARLGTTLLLVSPTSEQMAASPPPQSSILDLADIFTPAPAPASTHCSADPWDIPGGHAGLREVSRLSLESLFLPSHLLVPPPPPRAEGQWARHYPL